MTEPTSGATTGHTNSEDSGPAREHGGAEFRAALERLLRAFGGLAAEVEVSAGAEWERAKPELKSAITELEKMVDHLSEGAKAALKDLGARLDRGSAKPDN